MNRLVKQSRINATGTQHVRVLRGEATRAAMLLVSALSVVVNRICRSLVIMFGFHPKNASSIIARCSKLKLMRIMSASCVAVNRSTPRGAHKAKANDVDQGRLLPGCG